MARYKDLCSGLFWLIFAIAMYKASFELKVLTIGAATTSFVGSGFMPRLVAVAIVFFSLLIIYRGLKTAFSKPTSEICRHDSLVAEYLPVLVSVGLLAVYILLLEKAGFVAMTIIYLFGQMMILATPEHRRPVLFLILALSCALVIYYTFREVFYLLLPESRLF
jgi:hypothetical protein